MMTCGLPTLFHQDRNPRFIGVDLIACWSLSFVVRSVYMIACGWIGRKRLPDRSSAKSDAAGARCELQVLHFAGIPGACVNFVSGDAEDAVVIVDRQAVLDLIETIC